MKIAIGSDHGGYLLKEEIKKHLIQKGYEVVDFGTNSTDSCDYPDFGYAVAKAVVNNEFETGILCCGTGIGISISANKVKGIRCAVVSDTFSAKMAKAHNNANILALGERVVGKGLALEIVDAFMSSEFEGERHQRRLDKIAKIEQKYLK
ncbi:ribose 5-phosphate isomerase B [Alkalithermobacter thermoalcaliphilus JW-YL-7 = DSM 7308]|uniref:Ribose 5-phosphate isomerase B n=1 Tax=Alkalithermobacter thermoalcaliphilus JW-YL-7 = DSM 7308 TaxID=1121328 RepID=A0A150FTM9_CLOPD|nr:sugar-phosphate isomerase, RpiB/LacA/LacB family [[Clostridium] paradoxum JW-YL-7 = DSM 7308]SHK71534.1 ribose 5-phosphate isomerase B [[Clostridium] paradoxum JW-YL-7 = DSM 7308]